MTDVTQFDTDMENLLEDILPGVSHNMSAYLTWNEQVVVAMLDVERVENDVAPEGLFNDRDIQATVRVSDFEGFPEVQDPVELASEEDGDGVNYYVESMWRDGISAQLNLRRH